VQGAWIFDEVAYCAGEHPEWNPLTGSSITGRVVDLEGNPVEGARFTIGMLNTTTAADGTFTLDNVNPGNWQFVASRDGFYTRLRKVTVGLETTVDIGDVKMRHS
jgi:hypothetical protein